MVPRICQAVTYAVELNPWSLPWVLISVCPVHQRAISHVRGTTDSKSKWELKYLLTLLKYRFESWSKLTHLACSFGQRIKLVDLCAGFWCRSYDFFDWTKGLETRRGFGLHNTQKAKLQMKQLGPGASIKDSWSPFWRVA